MCCNNTFSQNGCANNFSCANTCAANQAIQMMNEASALCNSCANNLTLVGFGCGCNRSFGGWNNRSGCGCNRSFDGCNNRSGCGCNRSCDGCNNRSGCGCVLNVPCGTTINPFTGCVISGNCQQGFGGCGCNKSCGC